MASYSTGRPVQPKRPRAEDPAYLDYVRAHPCCLCDAPGPSEAHHYGRGSGMARRCDDREAVPLCSGCHVPRWHSGAPLPDDMTRAEARDVFDKVGEKLRAGWDEAL